MRTRLHSVLALVLACVAVLLTVHTASVQTGSTVYLPQLSSSHAAGAQPAASQTSTNAYLPLLSLPSQGDAGSAAGSFLPNDKGLRLQPTLQATPVLPADKAMAAAIVHTAVTTRTLDQIAARVAFNPATNEYLVVWEDQYTSTDYDIYARRVDGAGRPAGPDFEIDRPSTVERNPSLTYNATTGEYLVVWESYSGTGPHTVYARRVSGTGSLLGDRITVAANCSFPAIDACSPDVACNTTTGDYLVSWVGGTMDNDSVHAQRLSSAGTLQGDVQTIGSGQAILVPSLVYHPSNNQFFAVWQEQTSPGDENGWDINGRRMDATGSPLDASDFAISTAVNAQRAPRLAADTRHGTYLVVWEDARQAATDSDIFGQRLSETGGILGGSFCISNDTEKRRFHPDVAYMAQANEFMVLWEHEYLPADPDIYMRRVSFYGTLLQTETYVAASANIERSPTLASGGGKAYFVVWEDGRDSATQAINLYATLAPVDVFSGSVYTGDTGDTSQPLSGVTVSLYASNDDNSLGTLLSSTTTNRAGYYELIHYACECDMFHLVETDPVDYYSIAAASSGGIVVNSNQIRYYYPASYTSDRTGNNFWDKVQEPEDGDPPANWASFGPSGWVTSQTVPAHIQVEDTFSGLNVDSAQYAYSTDGGSVWSSWKDASCTGSSGTIAPQTITTPGIPFGQDSAANGLNRVKFRIRDMAGNSGTSPVYAVKIDTTPPQNPSSLSSPSHTPAVWSTDQTIDVQWNAGSDTGSGLDGYRFSWKAFSDNNPQDSTTALAATSPNLGSSSSLYFNLRAVDKAGNLAAATLHLGPFYVDVSPPTSCSITSPASFAAWPVPTSFTVNWSYQDVHSGIDRYDVQWRDGSGAWQNWRMSTTNTLAQFNAIHNQHTYGFRVRARDKAGNVSAYACQTQTAIQVPTCSDGIKNRNETGVDCGGTFCPPCAACGNQTKYAPTDTPCTQPWPAGQGNDLDVNSVTRSCDSIEICSPALDSAVVDALLCCENADFAQRLTGARAAGKIAACTYAQTQAYPLGLNNSYNPASLKRCLAHYSIDALGRQAVYLQGYFHGELSCYDSGDKPAACPSFEVKPAAWEMGTVASCAGSGGARPDYLMGGHRCEYYWTWFFGTIKWGKAGYWKSDTDFSKNNDSLGEMPTHSSDLRMSTGTCVDYSMMLTTLLRKLGYSKSDALSVDGDGHNYNLVRFPGETKWHYVDDVGNNGGGVYGGAFPSPASAWYSYCTALDDGCYNDAYDEDTDHCPSNAWIFGCEAIDRSSVAASALTPIRWPQPEWSTAPDADPACTETNPCTGVHEQTAPAPLPAVALDVSKAIAPAQIVLGQAATVTITITSQEAEAVTVLVEEPFAPGVTYTLTSTTRIFEGFTYHYHPWTLALPAKGTRTLVFTVTPTTLGSHALMPTLASAGGSQYMATGPIVTVLCTPNGACGPSETHQFCPNDCPTGIQDNVCDLVADGRADPDCTFGADVDTDPNADTDGDGVKDSLDLCPLTPAGAVHDATGCACDQKICADANPATVDRCIAATAACVYLPDGDRDGVPDGEDNCPAKANPDQTDSNDNGVGDACDETAIAKTTTLDGTDRTLPDPLNQGAIVVSAPNVVFDCAGATLRGSGAGTGIYVPATAHHVTIKNCTITGYRYGIWLDGSANNVLLNNTLVENAYGIVLNDAAGNRLEANTATRNAYAGVYVEGSDATQIRDNTVVDNAGIGLFLHTSSSIDVAGNEVCSNPQYDFGLHESTGIGAANQCDKPGAWNDTGTTGCSYACAEQATEIYLPHLRR